MWLYFSFSGEDRWFCTLLVEAGWKLEYCATSEDSTYCPEEFDEFFKQRRRWGPSTFANSIIVLDRQSSIRKNNDAISFFFIVYQMVLMVSSIIGYEEKFLFYFLSRLSRTKKMQVSGRESWVNKNTIPGSKVHIFQEYNFLLF